MNYFLSLNMCTFQNKSQEPESVFETPGNSVNPYMLKNVKLVLINVVCEALQPNPVLVGAGVILLGICFGDSKLASAVSAY